MKFYYTYGSEGQDFEGGWTEVEAENRSQADKLFLLFHPLRNGCIPCGEVYTESEMKETEMWTKGNFKKFCQERISHALPEM